MGGRCRREHVGVGGMSTADIDLRVQRGLGNTDHVADAMRRARTQRDAAQIYAIYIGDESITWATVNQAIVDHWSLSGLERVKGMAWKALEGER